jgi:hypothetical protein
MFEGMVDIATQLVEKVSRESLLYSQNVPFRSCDTDVYS